MNTLTIRNTFTFKNINFWEFFFAYLGLFLLSIFSFGLVLPYFYFWTYRYFYSRMELGDKPVTLTGKLSEFYFPMLVPCVLIVVGNYFNSEVNEFGKSFSSLLGLLSLSAIVIVLSQFYINYFMYKYFLTNLEIEGEKLQYHKTLGSFFSAFIGLFILSVICSITIWVLHVVLPDSEISLFFLEILIISLLSMIITFFLVRYFFSGLGWKEYRSIFNADFRDTIFPIIGIALMSTITFGFGFIYAMYWIIIFSYTNIEFVEESTSANTGD